MCVCVCIFLNHVLQSLAKEKPKPMRFTRKEMARQAALTEKEDAHGSPDADAEGDTSGALPAEEDLSAEVWIKCHYPLQTC